MERPRVALSNEQFKAVAKLSFMSQLDVLLSTTILTCRLTLNNICLIRCSKENEKYCLHISDLCADFKFASHSTFNTLTKLAPVKIH